VEEDGVAGWRGGYEYGQIWLGCDEGSTVGILCRKHTVVDMWI
jgi:hypothetical protein